MATRSLCVVRDRPELIKPAAATPSGTVFLPNIDQQFFFHVEMLYIYKADPSDTGDAVDKLRQALSKLLVPYYFAAGRFQVNEEEAKVEINCNGAGALFAGASCDSSIEDLGDLRQSNPELCKLVLVPDLDNIEKIEDVPLITIQVTKFSCGGIVVGKFGSHTLFDGVSAAAFLYDYGLVVRGEQLPELPSCDRTGFRARNPPQPSRDHPEITGLPDIPARLFFNSGTKGILLPHVVNASQNTRKVETKFFPITSKMLAKLKEKALEDGVLSRCSSFEALAAYIWKVKAICLSDEEEPSKIAKLITTVNVRGRMKTRSVPKKLSGNGVAYACVADTTVEDLCNKPLSYCTKKIQEAVAAVDEEYVLSEIDYCETVKYGVVDFFGGTIIGSLNKLLFHEVDFGWGKPTYARPAGSQHELVEYVRLYSNCKDDGGLDLCMNMYSDKMPLLEKLLMELDAV